MRIEALIDLTGGSLGSEIGFYDLWGQELVSIIL